MLVEWAGHARAVCRLSVAEARRLWPSAFAIFMVSSLLMADGLLPVLAARYRTELALYSNGGYPGPSTRDSGGGADEGGGGGGGGGGDGGTSVSTGSRVSLPKSASRSHVGARGGSGVEHNIKRDSGRKSLLPNSYRRSKTAFVSGTGEVMLENSWGKGGSIRTSSSNLISDSKPDDTLNSQSKREERLNEETFEAEEKKRQSRQPSSRLARSSSASSPGYSLQSSFLSSSPSLLSSASSFLSLKERPSAPSIGSVSPFVKSSPSKPSHTSVSSPPSVPSSSSAFSTSSLSESSSNNRQNAKKTKNNSKSKSKHRVLYNHYKHQKQRVQERGYDWALHSSLVSLNSDALGIRSDSINRSSSHGQQAHFYKYHRNHHDKTDNKQSNSITNNIRHSLHKHSIHHSLMQRDEVFPEAVAASESYSHVASARYARHSNSTRENCAATNGTQSCYCLKGTSTRLDSHLADLVCGGLQSPDCLDVAQHSHLTFCSDYDMTSLSGFLPFATSRERSKEESNECRETYKRVLKQDRLAEEYFSGFLDLIGRYDCTQSYSVKWNCTHCKVGYRSIH